MEKDYKDSRSYKIERFLDRHNHKLELIRTFGTIVTVLVALKVFGLI